MASKKIIDRCVNIYLQTCPENAEFHNTLNGIRLTVEGIGIYTRRTRTGERVDEEWTKSGE
jgi:hypothetical protein